MSVAPSELAAWLRCPECGHDLEATPDAQLGCESGHRFGLNKLGYAALLVHGARTGGDRAPQLDAAEARAASGALDAFGEALDATVPHGRAGALLDVGAGSGVHTARLVASRPGWRALALDVSPLAVARATARSRAAGLVADATREWPVRDGAATAIVVVDAPWFPAEFHRVLAPGGTLVVAGDVDPGETVDDLWTWFEHDQTRHADGAAVVRLRRRRRPLD